MITILVLLIFNSLVLYYYKNFTELVNVFDVPDNKLKLHEYKTPIFGGIIIILNYLIFFSSYYFYEKNYFYKFELNEILSLIFLVLSFFFVGFYDDKKKLSPYKKIILLIIILIIALSINKNLILEKISLSFFESKIFFGNFSIPFTIFCIILLTNSLNFFDGINGQSSIFFTVIFSYLFFNSDNNLFYVFNFFLVLFVLILNLKKKLFLGDGGVFLLTIISSISLIYEYNLNRINYADEIFLLLLLPGLDLIRLTITRLYRGQNPFYGDRNHIHHLFIKRFSLIKTNLALLILSIVPIILFLLTEMKFFLVFISFISIYTIVILFLKFNDPKHNYR